MELRTLEKIPLADIQEAFNLGFSDYSIPLKLTLEQLEQKIIAENIALDISVGAFVDEKLVGFILHGIKIKNNKTIAYNGGTAVLPEYRGQQLTKKMYQFMMPFFESKKVSQVILEVIESNFRALKTYEAIGFNKIRRLSCFKGCNNTVQSSSIFETRPMKNLDWDTMLSFWDITPTWQNDIDAVKSILKDCTTVEAHDNDKMIGYLIYNPNNYKLLQLAVHKDYRKQSVGQSLLHHVTKDNAQNIIVTNVEEVENGPTDWCNKVGLQHLTNLLEMKLNL